jgi:hypothetical protein
MTKQGLVGEEVFVCDLEEPIMVFYGKVERVLSKGIRVEDFGYSERFCLPSEITPGDPRGWPWKNVEDLEDE